MSRKKLNHKEMKALVLKVVADCRGLADEHIKSWQPFNMDWQTIEGVVYLRLSDDTQVAVERGSLEQQIHIAISEAQYRSEQEQMNYRITEFYIEPGITGTHGNRPLASLMGFARFCRFLAPHQATAQHQPQEHGENIHLIPTMPENKKRASKRAI